MIDGKSINIKTEQLEKLKSVFPEAVSEGKIDFEKLKLTLGDDFIIEDERYVLNWAGKSDAFRVIQTPTTATLKPRKDESVNFNATENVIIEGENLEVLKVLQKSYYNKMKMIYIDPPYNTGNDNFIYPDKFSETKEEYLKRIGEMDEGGYLTKEGLFRKNSKESGRFHSNWLSMMYPRLFLARNLLRDDGVIFVSIDDNEVHNLRLMMNEIFGEENFVAQIIWKSKYGAGAKTTSIIELHEYILCYAKHHDLVTKIGIPLSEKLLNIYNKKDEKFEIRGPYATWPLETTSMDERPNLRYAINYSGEEIWPRKQWLWSKERVDESMRNNELVFNKMRDGKWSVRFKGYLKDEDGQLKEGTPKSIIDDVYTQDGTKELTELFPDLKIFDFPKPAKLLRRLLNFSVEGNFVKHDAEDITLDFFAGSGTTAQAVMELNKEDLPASGQAGGGNRRFILVQLPEKTDEESEAYKAGYKTIAEICKERIRRVIKKLNEEKEAEQKKAGEANPLFTQPQPRHVELVSASETSPLGFKVFMLEPSNFKIWRTDTIESEDDLKKQMDAFADPVKANAAEENMMWEILLKSGYELTTNVETLKIHGTQVYSVADGETMMTFTVAGEVKSLESLFQEIIKRKPKQCICLDKLFVGNDQLKTNTVLQMKDANVEFKTI